MIKGSTVIMSDQYISELERHKEICEKRFELETRTSERTKYEKELNMYQHKIEKALEFQDVVDEILHIDIPRLTVVKTISGVTLPISHVQVI